MRPSGTMAVAVVLLRTWPVVADPEAIADANRAALVVTVGHKADGAPVQASGCVIDAKGTILTTAHQVLELSELKVRTLDGREHPAEIVAADPDRDFALVRSPYAPRIPARIGDAARLKMGSPLIAIASPMGLEFSAVGGIVSSTDREYRVRPDAPAFPVIQTDLPAAPGSSGGPVFDADGALVGIVMGRIGEVDGAVLMNPVNNAYDLLRRNGVHGPVANAEAVEAYNRGVAADGSEEKIAAYSRAVELDPRFFQAWFNLGVALASSGQTDRAIAAYRAALALEPASLPALRNLGRVLLQYGKLEDARIVFDEALRLDPDNPKSHNDAGEVRRAAGRIPEAEAAFREALRLDPDYAPAHYNLALVLATTERPAEAARHLENYLRLSPDAPDQDEVLVRINELKGK